MASGKGKEAAIGTHAETSLKSLVPSFRTLFLLKDVRSFLYHVDVWSSDGYELIHFSASRGKRALKLQEVRRSRGWNSIPAVVHPIPEDKLWIRKLVLDHLKQHVAKDVSEGLREEMSLNSFDDKAAGWIMDYRGHYREVTIKELVFLGRPQPCAVSQMGRVEYPKETLTQWDREEAASSHGSIASSESSLFSTPEPELLTPGEEEVPVDVDFDKLMDPAASGRAVLEDTGVVAHMDSNKCCFAVERTPQPPSMTTEMFAQLDLDNDILIDFTMPGALQGTLLTEHFEQPEYARVLPQLFDKVFQLVHHRHSYSDVISETTMQSRRAENIRILSSIGQRLIPTDFVSYWRLTIIVQCRLKKKG